VKKASEFLSKDGIRQLLGRLQKQQLQCEDRLTAYHLEELAGQLGDTELLEELLTTRRGHLKTEDFVALAKVHFENGDYQQALDSLGRDPEDDAAESYLGERIQLECLKQLGRAAELQIIAWQKFSEYPDENRFKKPVESVGEERRTEQEQKAVKLVLEGPELRAQSALLLMSLEREFEAEEYVLSRHEQLKDALYTYLLEPAQAFRVADYHLAATVCYRALLVDILESKRSKAYQHTADYCQALCDMDDYVVEWRNFPRHTGFVNALRARHGRKMGFWRRVEEREHG
jgi:uncharacterized protein DUF6880